MDAIYWISTILNSGSSSAYNTHQSIRHPAIASRPILVAPILVDVKVDVRFWFVFWIENVL